MDSRPFLLFTFGIILNVFISSAEEKKAFNYTINNQLEKPFFNESMEFTIVNNKPLMYYMKKSVLQDPDRFTSFTATFNRGSAGYFIGAINGQWGNWFVNKTWWSVWNANGLLPLGVSSYIPVENDQIVFNFTQGLTEH